jgi:hypothetical protein
LKTIEDFKKTVWEKLIDAGDLTNAAKVLQETDASKISGYISALPQTEKPNIFGSADGGYYEQYYDTASKSWKVKSVIGPSTPNGAQASTGFSDLETEQDARAEISKQLQLNKTPQEAFNIVRLLFSRNEVSDSALEELTGVAEQKRQEEVKKNQKMVQNLPISKGSTSKNGASRTTAQPLVSSLSYKAPSLDDFNDVTKGIASFFNF